MDLSTNSNPLVIDEEDNSIWDHFDQLLEVKQGHFDVRLIGSDGYVEAHRIILSTFSPMLHKLLGLQGNSHRGMQEVLLPDFTIFTIANLLEVTYSGEVVCQFQEDIWQLRDLMSVCGIENGKFTLEKVDVVVDDDVVVIDDDDETSGVTKKQTTVKDVTLKSGSGSSKRKSPVRKKSEDSDNSEVVSSNTPASSPSRTSELFQTYAEPLEPIDQSSTLNDEGVVEDLPEDHSITVAYISNPAKASERFHCPICSRSYVRKSDATRHLRTVHNKFCIKWDVMRHVNHKCATCKAEFITKSLLTIHSLIHTAIFPVLCPLCMKTNDRPSDLTAHIEYHRLKIIGDKQLSKQRVSSVGKITKPENNEHEGSCSFCSQKFSDEAMLILHQEWHKTKFHPVTYCPLCKQKYPNRSGLLAHVRTHLPNAKLTCKICNELFSSAEHLAAHKQECHRRSDNKSQRESSVIRHSDNRESSVIRHSDNNSREGSETPELEIVLHEEDRELQMN